MRTYIFKLYKAKRNKKLHKVINIAGIIYNHCIALHKRYYRLFKKSLNIYKLQKHLTKLKKIANQRKDFQFKLANAICKKYALICIEDLNIKGMQKRWVEKYLISIVCI